MLLSCSITFSAYSPHTHLQLLETPPNSPLPAPHLPALRLDVSAESEVDKRRRELDAVLNQQPPPSPGSLKGLFMSQVLPSWRRQAREQRRRLRGELVEGCSNHHARSHVMWAACVPVLSLLRTGRTAWCVCWHVCLHVPPSLLLFVCACSCIWCVYVVSVFVL